MLDLKGDNIFGCCRQILDKVEKGMYVYNTDGLIFTPIENGVGGNKKGKKQVNLKELHGIIHLNGNLLNSIQLTF